MMKIKLWEDKIPYYTEGYDTPNSMTAYTVNTWHKLPAIVVLPGGGYIKRAEHEGVDIAKFYNEMGIHAFVVDYRLYPNMFPCALADAQRAIKIIKDLADELKVDENKIFVIVFLPAVTLLLVWQRLKITVKSAINMMIFPQV